VIVAAALCPWPPLLVRELTGADPVLPELRAACAGAVAALLRDRPEVVAVVGPGTVTARWPGDGRLNVTAFGGLPPAAPDQAGRPVLPPAPGIGAYLLDQAGYAGERLIWSVSADEPVAGCRKLGGDLAGRGPRTALLVLGDGSARRGRRAPGHIDERAPSLDARLEQAVRAGDTRALLDTDPGLARELMATGRPAWQVMAGALEGYPGLSVDVPYAGDPFGVYYLVATLRPPIAGGSGAGGPAARG
jgi:hypothetical protein